jgi:hypothetical protein
MANLMLMHPGAHPHPHESDWLAVIADTALMAVAVAALVAVIAGIVWLKYAARE